MKAVLTGASGYVGGILASHFARRGWETVSPVTKEGQPWRLPENAGEESFRNADTLIHCAWDMRPSSRKEAQETNVCGSRRLFTQAAAAGVKRLIFISSMSAFEDSRSAYGQMKFTVEQQVVAAGGVVVRPGLVYGKHAGGMVGKLLGLIRKSPLLPLPCADAQQYLIDEETLAHFVSQAAESRIPSGVYALAHPESHSMRDIVKLLGQSLHRSVSVISVPWQIAYVGLSFAQSCGVRLPVTTDNLLGLAFPNPSPDFSALAQLGISAKKFPDGLLS